MPIEGKPVVREVPDTRFERVINTHAMLARTRFDKTWYLHVYDGWVSSNSLDGPWTQVGFAPLGLDDLAKQLAQSGAVDLLDGSEGATPKPALANGVPAIHVTEVPTELIVFKGQPDLVPITGTPLLWATNSATDVIVDTTNNAYYVLMAGRWFRAPGLGGPWTFLGSNALPPSFRQIPAKGTPASIVLASVAGTPQAQEAVIANSIPQTAAVARNGGPTFTPEFDGAPQWQPVAGTPLRYVANSKVPVIAVNPGAYYAVTGGVWFSASALTGPWVVATTVPGVIYTIPVSSPLHYVTYVHVFGYTDDVVYAGYTPSYLGTVVATGGTVVYGTGYAYTPWIGSVWYGAPVTYGVAAMPVYNPYVGFTFGFAMGLTAAYWAEPYWGGAYYHAGYYGNPCCGSATADVYRSWPGGVSSGTRTYWAKITAAPSARPRRATTAPTVARPGPTTPSAAGIRTPGRVRRATTEPSTPHPAQPARSIATRPTTRRPASAAMAPTCRRPARVAARSIATSRPAPGRRDSAATPQRRPITRRRARPRPGTTVFRRTTTTPVPTATFTVPMAVAAGSSTRQAGGTAPRVPTGQAASSRRVAARRTAPAAGAAAGIEVAAARESGAAATAAGLAAGAGAAAAGAIASAAAVTAIALAAAASAVAASDARAARLVGSRGKFWSRARRDRNGLLHGKQGSWTGLASDPAG